MDNNLVHTHIDSDGKEYTHSHTHTHTHTQTKAVINRLSKRSGHVESIKRMVESGRDCSEVLTQLAAGKAAVSAVSSIVLKDHIEHCIVDAARENDKEAIADLIKSIDRFVK